MTRNARRRRGDVSDEMQRMPLDDHTSDRLLAGAVRPEDAPPGYEGAASVLHTAAGELPGIDPARQETTVAAMATALHSTPASPPSPRRNVVSRFSTAKKALAAGAAALSLTGVAGVAGALPGPAQDVLHDAVSHIGVNLPDGSTADNEALEDDDPSTSTTVADHPANHGACVSMIAHDSQGGFATSSGNHGQVVSAAARSDCGKKDKDGDDETTASTTSTSTPTTEAEHHERRRGSDDHPSNSNAPSDNRGQSGEQHGQSGEQHGQSGQPHGQSGEQHGNSGHGNSGHGNSGHGNSGHGNDD